MKIRVVIADDHKIVMEGLGALIRQQSDMDLVAEAENGREAVALAEKLKPDIVLMDISMPGMNGIAATRQVVSAVASPKVIIMSMYDDRKYIIESFRAGATGYMPKSSSFAELIDAIRTVQAGRYYLGRDCAGIVVADILRDGARSGLARLGQVDGTGT